MARPFAQFVGIPSALICLASAAAGQLETRASFPIVQGPYVVASGVFSRSGYQDVAVVCFEAFCGGGVQVLLGKGDGTFKSATSYPAGDSPEFGIITADFNGDGNLDIAVSDYLAFTVSVLLGNGDGTFQPAISSPAPGDGAQVQVGDFNKDHIPDLALVAADCP